MKGRLLLALFVGNVALVASYLLVRPTADDFGRVPKRLHYYFLVTASVCFLCIFSGVAALSFAPKLDDVASYLAVSFVALYYALQIGFLPTVRLVQKNTIARGWVPALLVASSLPIVGLLIQSIVAEAWVAVVFLAISTIHLVVNDALVFSWKF